MKKIIILILINIFTINLYFSQNLINGLIGSGSEIDPVSIYSVNDLKLLSKFVMDGPDYSQSTAGKYFVLMNDINFQENDLEFDFDNDGIIESNFIPIGGRKDTIEESDYRLFQGIFNGCGNVIRGLKIKYNTIGYVALFGCTWSAEIINLGIEDGVFFGTGCVAPLCGQIRGKVSYCFSKNCIINNNYWFTGGLFGASYDNSEINNCYSNNNIVTGTMWVGGFIGNNNNGSQINNSYCSNIVHTTDSSSSYGGFNGSNEGNSIIENCYYKEDWAATSNITQIPQAKLGSEKSISFMKSQYFVDSLNLNQDSILIYDIPEETPKAIWYSDNSSQFNSTLPILWWEYLNISNSNIYNYPEISLYPNPAKNYIIIENCSNSNFFIYNNEGKLIKKGIINDNSYNINICDLLNGIYILKIANNNNINIRKIIKQ